MFVTVGLPIFVAIAFILLGRDNQKQGSNVFIVCYIIVALCIAFALTQVALYLQS